MSRLIPFVLLAAMAVPSAASKRDTVAQLEQELTAACAAHKPDVEIARKIGNMELSERLTEADLERLKALVVPGSEPAMALQLLADKSAFLDLPASGAPTIAASDPTAQQQCSRGLETMLRRHCRGFPISSPPAPLIGTTIARRRSRKAAGRFVRDCTRWTLRAGKSQCVTNERINLPRRVPRCGSG